MSQSMSKPQIVSQTSYHLAKIEITLITELICIDMTEIKLFNKIWTKTANFCCCFYLIKYDYYLFFLFIKNLIKDNNYFSEK
jgi:hypothetical protein